MKISSIIFFFLFMTECYSQYEPLYSFYSLNYSIQNPSTTGIGKKHFASINGRQEWLGIEDAPILRGAMYEINLDSINSGIGLSYINYITGPTSLNNVNLNYAYQFDLKKERILSTGISFSLYNYRLDASKIQTLNPDSDINDDILSENYVNFNIGLTYKVKKLIIGLSAIRLRKYNGMPHTNFPTYNFNCTYNIPIGKRMEIIPSIILMSNSIYQNFDLNLTTFFNNQIWVGCTYHRYDEITFMGGIDIVEKFRIGYAYDHIRSKLSEYTNGSHELVLAILLE